MNLDSLSDPKNRLEQHPIFSRINTIDDLKVFMECHVFAVWDFMSLLKKLQQDLVPTGSPWVPSGDGSVARFVNEIVMEEESDETSDKTDGIRYSSHFEIYLEAMKEVGASTDTMNKFLFVLRNEGLENALSMHEIPKSSKTFMNHTFELIERGKTHEVAASFAIGRESIVPLMFKRILADSDISSEQAPVFHYYLERHTHLDEEHHGPMALRLLENLCKEKPVVENEILQQASASIEARILFWDEVLEAFPTVAKAEEMVSHLS